MITQAIALACHSIFEINIKRRYFIRPYVSKKFQPLCSASCPIEDHLFPKDLSKRMKKITDASEINTVSFCSKKLQRKALWKGPELQGKLVQTPRTKGTRLSETSQRAHERPLPSLKVSMCIVESFKACILERKLEQWQKLTVDNWILSTVKGYKIEFFTPILSSAPKTIDFGETQNQIVDNEIIELLQKGAISECKYGDNEFISNIFLVKKKGGKFRPVINLKRLNKFIEYHHFKMENIETVLNSIKRNSYFVNLDLQNAYFSLSIHKSYRKYLKFEWRHKLYQFNCLCFGISSAPRVFSKLMKVIFAHIRRMGISAFYYIDDSLTEADSSYLCTNQSQTLMTMMKTLVFTLIMKNLT